MSQKGPAAWAATSESPELVGSGSPPLSKPAELIAPSRSAPEFINAVEALKIRLNLNDL